MVYMLIILTNDRLGTTRRETEKSFPAEFLFMSSAPVYAYFRYSNLRGLHFFVLEATLIIDISLEFFEQVKIVTYPPPLHYYEWDKLREGQRQIALGQLQEISKDDYQIAYGKFPDQDLRREWRPWLVMEPASRQHAYNTLQVGSDELHS